MAKILNLDVVAPIEKRELVLNGNSYPVRGMTVQDFVESTQQADKLKDSKDFKEQIDATIDLIKRGCPTLEDEILRAMSMEQIRMVLEFVRGEDPAAIAKRAETLAKTLNDAETPAGE